VALFVYYSSIAMTQSTIDEAYVLRIGKSFAKAAAIAVRNPELQG